MRLPHALRRLLRKTVAVWYHPSYRLPLASEVGAPTDPRRADDALTWAVDRKIVHPSEIHESPELSWEDAARVHDHAYLASLDRPAVVAALMAAEVARVPAGAVLETWRRGAGATLAATRHVRSNGGRAINLLGGFHHAWPDRGSGFCAINDVAVAVRVLREEGLAGAVLVVDLDAHPPDGIVACLSNDDDVEIRSLSTASAWRLPSAEAAQVQDRRVPSGSEDGVYLAAVDALLEDLPEAEIAFYLAGADPLAGDELGGLAVSRAGLRERDRRVLRALGDTPTVILSAGGYHKDSWRVLAATIAVAAQRSATVAADYDPMHRRTRDIMRTLDPATLQSESGDLGLTEAELLGALRVPSLTTEPRFLGYYTRHGLEHAFTAYGFLGTLRRLGFSSLDLQLESGATSDRIRIRASNVGSLDPGTPSDLVDLSASRGRVHDFDVLFIHWLELRDPRSPFTPNRPKLPGQRQPGLGLADEIGHLLVRAAERLGLAGVAFVPAHYHVAWMSRRRFVFVEPEPRGQFQAIRDARRSRSLLETTTLLATTGLPTHDGTVVRWRPAEMVSALAPELHARLEADGPAAERARAAFAARLEA